MREATNGARQSRKHLTGKAFTLLEGYNATKKLYKFIPCDIAFDCPNEVEDQSVVLLHHFIPLVKPAIAVTIAGHVVVTILF